MPFFSYVKKHSLAFLFPWAHIYHFPIQVVHELSVLANNISSDQGEFCTMPNIETTDQNDLGIQSNSPKASFVTNLEPGHNINKEAFPIKVLAGKGSPCHKSSSKSG